MARGLPQRMAGKQQEILDIDCTHPSFWSSQGPNLHSSTCKYASDLACQSAYLQDPEVSAKSLG